MSHRHRRPAAWADRIRLTAYGPIDTLAGQGYGRLDRGNRRGPLKRLSIACLLVSLALIAVPAQAGAAYYPFGPKTFVDMSELDGWQLCFSDEYGDTTDPSLDGILAQCNGDPLLLAGGPTGSRTLTVLATAPRADV